MYRGDACGDLEECAAICAWSRARQALLVASHARGRPCRRRRELLLHQAAEVLQEPEARLGEVVRTGVEQAQRPDADALRDEQRAPGIKPNAGWTGDQRILRKAGVEEGVGDEHDLVMQDRVGTQGHLTRKLLCIDSIV